MEQRHTLNNSPGLALERRFSSMTLVNKFDFRRNLIKIRVLNVWFRRYLKEKRIAFTKPLAHYIGLVEEWETKVRIARSLYIFGLLMAFLGAFALSLPYFCDPSHKTIYQIASTFLIACALFFIFLGLKASTRTKKNKPRAVLVQLVYEYRKVLSAADATTLWGDYIYAQDTDQTEDQILELQRECADETKLPQFLIEVAEAKLRTLGQQISDLESQCKDADAADIRNGVFTRCYKDAILFEAIPEKTGFGEFIPDPVF